MIHQIFDFLANHLTIVGILLFAGVSYWSITKRERQHKYAQKLLDKAIKANAHEPISLHPEIDPTKCAGCGACTAVCPEGDVLKLINHKAVLVSASKCVGHGECERSCPFGAISLVFGTKTRGVEIPRVTKDYETNVPGLYIAGELGGMGLIRNAVKQGTLAATHALESMDKSGQVDADLVVVGAGPGGLSASLTAIAKKASYICLEQGSFGGTVYNFPRQKVVMTHPADLPGFGTMKFNQNKVSKEELLGYWDMVRKKTGLKISEQERFETVTGSNGAFEVKTTKRTIRARKVILAMGVRGSPRRLGVPGEDSPKVTYNLIDPEQYQGQHVAVVGGGNAGVECAQYLAKEQYKNKVTLLVHGASMDRANEENRNIIEAMEKKGLVTISYHSSVKEVHPGHVVMSRNGETVEIKNDFLFVFIGAEMPFKFLMSLGISIDKKFGEGL